MEKQDFRDTLRNWFAQQFTRGYGKVRVLFGEDMPVVTTPLSHELPANLAGYLPYITYDPQRQLYQNEKSAGLILEVSPMGYLTEADHEILAQIFNDTLPAGIHVQIINWASPKIGYTLDRWAKARSEAGGVYIELAKQRREYLKNGVWNSLSPSEPFFLRNYRCFMCFELAGDIEGEAGKELENIKSVVTGTMLTLRAAVRPMAPEELLDFVRCVMNPTSDLRAERRFYDKDVAIREQVLSRDTSINVFREKLITTAWANGDDFYHEGPGLPDDAKRETYEIRTFSADRFPETSTQSAMSALLGDFFNAQLQPIGSTLTMLYFTPWTYEATKTMAEMKTLRMTNQAGGMNGKLFPAVRAAAADWDQVNNDVARGIKLVNMGMFCASITPPGEMADKAERSLRSVWTNAGFGISANNMMHLPSLLSFMPLSMGSMYKDFDTMKRFRKMPASCMALLAPLQGEYQGAVLPHMLLSGRRGQLFFFSPFANGEEGEAGGNHNVAVIGSSGSGKSFLIQELVCSLRGGGTHCMIIDDGRSFENVCKIQKGQHIEFKLDDSLCINPFSMFDHSLAQRDKEYRSECLEAIRALVLQMAVGDGTASKEETGAIAEAVMKVWEASGIDGNIHQVGEYLKANFGEIGRVMRLGMNDYCEGGAYYDLYNGRCSLEINNPFTVFELGPIEAKKELRAVVVIGLLILIRQRMKFGGRGVKKALVIDEAWQLLGNGAAGAYIEGFARRCRKEGGALITGTQSLEDYQATSGGRACINNSDWNITMRLKEEALDSFKSAKIMAASDADMRIMRSLTTKQGYYSEAFIRGPGNIKVLGRLSVDPFTATLYSTRAETFDAVQRLISAGMSTEEAVRMVAFRQPAPVKLTEPEENFYRQFLQIPMLKDFVNDWLGMEQEEQVAVLRRIRNLKLDGHSAKVA